jgi:Calcineurin-like phosphoesterase
MPRTTTKTLPTVSICVRTLMMSLLLLPGWAAASAIPASQESVVAVGDVHGDLDDFVALLQHIGLIDKQSHWTGGKTTLVQLGDLLDRGPKPREVMDLLISLENESSKDGGRVVPLLGNHEAMNIMGDLRYVTPENFASFADAKSEERRKSAYNDYVKWRDSHSALLAELPQPLELTEGEWMARHPPGFIEQREAFSPEGSYGKWLRGHAAIAEINGVIFLHGGISPSVAAMKLNAINSAIRDEFRTFDSCKQRMLEKRIILPFFNLQEIVAAAQAEVIAEKKSKVSSSPDLQSSILQFLKLQDWLSVRPDGPLWFRGYDQWSDEEGSSQVDKILQSFKVSHLVTAHTVQRGGRIRSRFGGKLFLIDTGMLSSYYPGGRASALEILNGKFTAKYPDQETILLEPASSSKMKEGSKDPARVGSLNGLIKDLSSLSVPSPEVR